MTWILIAALLPAALLFHYIYRRDPVKAPTRELVKGFFFGVLAAPASLLVSVPLTYLGSTSPLHSSERPFRKRSPNT